MRLEAPERLALRAVQAFLAAVLALTLFLALVVPYHTTDALVYGVFSREIGEHGGFLFDAIGAPPYSRPLFYVTQGWLWWLFGAHEWIGRLESLAFFALLAWSVFRLARDRTLPALAPWLALVLLLACPDVVVQAIAGQTDVPVAALIALLAVLVWRHPLGLRAAVLVALVAAAAVLAKATALPALAGLAAAMLLGDRAGLWDRVRYGVLPIAAGTALALVYGVLMARHFGLALNEFLGGVVGTSTPVPGAGGGASTAVGAAPAVGVGGGGGGGAGAGSAPSSAARVAEAFSAFTDSDRPAVLARVEWLGPYVRMLALFGVAYAAARTIGVAHRIAALVALALGLVGYWVGPEVLAGGAGVLDTSAGAIAGSVLLLVPLAAVAWCPPELRASRLLLARLLVWGVPPLIAWGLFGILGDTRTLSPAWPALIVLIAAVAAMGVAGLAARSAWLAAAAVVLLLGLAVLDLRNYDGLGARPDGTVNSVRALRELTPSTWLHPDAARRAADPQLGGLVDATRAARPSGGRVLTNDGRLPFYFLDETDVVAPLPSCEQLPGHRVLTLIVNGFGPAELDGLTALARCPGVRLTPAAAAPGSYAVYAIGATG